MKKFPHICFYTGDWMKDPRLSLCKPATRGVWIDLLCAMHEFDRSGELRGTTDQLARLARCSTEELVSALTELQTTGAADLLQRNGTWAIANRRMKKEAITREKRAVAGSIGGSKSGANRQQKPDTDNEDECESQIIQYCISLGLPASDGKAVFAKWQGNNWTNGGQAIRDWKATIRSWKLQGYLPSQRLRKNEVVVVPKQFHKSEPPPAEFIDWHKRNGEGDNPVVAWRSDRERQAFYKSRRES